MGFWRKIFGSSQSNSHQEASSASQEATSVPMQPRLPEALSKRIREASHIADKNISIQPSGGQPLITHKFTLGQNELLTAIDAALELAPRDLNLLFAKSEAHDLSGQGKTARELRAQVLMDAPNHFDARMREDYFDRWGGLFEHHGWAEDFRTLPAAMLALEAEGPVLIVRDGLVLTPAVVYKMPAEDLSSRNLDVAWQPVWANTPYGPIFAHYLITRNSDNERGIYEFFISPYPINPVHMRHGNWLIRRFCEVDNILIVFHEGQNAWLNKRFTIPDDIRATLHSAKKKFASLDLPNNRKEKDSQAMNWYMNNSDINKIRDAVKYFA